MVSAAAVRHAPAAGHLIPAVAFRGDIDILVILHVGRRGLLDAPCRGNRGLHLTADRLRVTAFSIAPFVVGILPDLLTVMADRLPVDQFAEGVLVTGAAQHFVTRRA